jgi:protein required for attachment to host cells
MHKSIVAVIDGSRARFLTLEPVDFPEHESGPNLIEQAELYNASHEQPDQELWANVKTGRNRGAGGQSHSYDDHRQNHRVEFERRFAQEITSQLISFTQIHQAQHLLLVAEPQILGLMREALAPVLPKHLKLNELAKDLCQLKPNQLHDYLASKELLPAHRKAPRAG